MRGALALFLMDVHVLGIIPAYAGSTATRGREWTGSGDHPRVCGEHLKSPETGTDIVGSSPRMRGALAIHVIRTRHVGIIPAYAGSTLAHVFPCCRKWDHPRVCGEHFPVESVKKSCSGSSPRMRGARKVPRGAVVVYGIIPAYAGSTRLQHKRLRNSRDHPRVCGEHRSDSARYLTRRGIIPAYAGSTSSRSSFRATKRDHPRVCGEHPLPRLYMQRCVGSSPRMRGARCASGVTAARARDHPRVCGEHLAVPWLRLSMRGSSPRMRGALSICFTSARHLGIIPAYAGST